MLFEFANRTGPFRHLCCIKYITEEVQTGIVIINMIIIDILGSGYSDYEIFRYWYARTLMRELKTLWTTIDAMLELLPHVSGLEKKSGIQLNFRLLQTIWWQ